MPNKELIVNEVKDPVSQENFDRIRQYLGQDIFNKFDGKFFEFEVSGAVTNFRYAHHLGFIPKDVIMTRGSGVTWNFDNFDRTFIDLTTTGATTIRAFIGTYKEENL